MCDSRQVAFRSPQLIRTELQQGGDDLCNDEYYLRKKKNNTVVNILPIPENKEYKNVGNRGSMAVLGAGGARTL